MMKFKQVRVGDALVYRGLVLTKYNDYLAHGTDPVDLIEINPESEVDDFLINGSHRVPTVSALPICRALWLAGRQWRGESIPETIPLNGVIA